MIQLGLYIYIYIQLKSEILLVAYSKYIGHEHRAKHPDLFVMRGISIAEAAKQRFDGEPGAEETLRIYWSGYAIFFFSKPFRYAELSLYSR